MHLLENGILDDSEIYFLAPSEFAKENLYYLQHIGIFHCDARYEATHEYWESILFLVLEKGQMKVSIEEEEFLLEAGDIVLIDCRKRHRYYALGEVAFYYFHFIGNCSWAYFQLLKDLNKNNLLKKARSSVIDSDFTNMIRLAKSQLTMQNEHNISLYIQKIFCDLLEIQNKMPSTTNDLINQSITYMDQHLLEKISLDELADYLNISKYYFARIFKSYMGLTPHNYFLNMKIQYAKRLLTTTDFSVEEIAEKVGFDSASNFIRTFKRLTDLTPAKFRKTAL